MPSVQRAYRLEHFLRAYAHPVVVGQSTPGNGAVGLDQEDRWSGDGAPARFAVFVDQPPRVNGPLLNIGEDRKLEAEFFRQKGRFLDGVDRNREDRGPSIVDLGET